MSASNGNSTTTASGRGWLLAATLVALVGLGAAGYLSQLHWALHNVPGHVSFCAISEGVNCDTVSISQYSVVLGVPVSTWGIVYYLVFLGLGVWGFFARRPPFPWGLLAAMSIGSVGVSVFLFLVSHLLIRAFCIMCLTLYAVNLVSALLCVFGMRKVGISPATTSAWIGLAASLGTLVYSLFFPDPNRAFLVVVGVALLLGAVALAIAGKRTGQIMFFKRIGQSVAAAFHPVWAGGAIALLTLAAVVTLPLVTPLFYPRAGDTIAGGLDDIATGRTQEGHNWIGAEHPDLVITEYSDYECPFCRRAHEEIRKLIRERKGWLRLVHVHVPLDHTCNKALRKPFHRHACDCARAAICADRQNRFWEMNDALFLRRGGLDAGGLAMLAQNMGLDTKAFRVCMDEDETEEKLQEDLNECRAVAKECRAIGKRFGTPTFTVGNRVVVGAKPMAFWVQLTDEMRKSGTTSGGACDCPDCTDPATQKQPSPHPCP
jgi:protein-disulfide isomerase/uncharacterized membrane protein